MRRTAYFGSILLLISTFTFFIFSVPKAAAFSGSGLGTPLNPYEITSCVQLEEMNNNLSASYELANNIHCAVQSTSPGYTPIGNGTVGFSGTFDGKGYMISDVTVDSGSLGQYTGVFGVVDGGTVSNVTIYHATISGWSDIGGLAGTLRGYGSASHVTVASSAVTGGVETGGVVGALYQFDLSDSTATFVTVHGYNSGGSTISIGGMAGYLSYATMSTDTVTDGSVTGNTYDPTQANSIGGLGGHDDGFSTIYDSYSTVDVTGNNMVGGLIGDLGDSSLGTSYATGTVTGNVNVGGLAGLVDTGIVSDSFAAGAVTGSLPTGGIVGELQYSATLSHDYWDAYRSNQSGCVGQTFGTVSVDCNGVNSGNLDPGYFFNSTSNNPLNNWDFSTVWRTQSSGFPVLQSVPGPPSTLDVTRGSTALDLAWTDGTDNGGTALTGYRIDWYAADNIIHSVTGLSASTHSYTLTGLTPSTDYTVIVRAVNRLGNGIGLGAATSTLSAPAPGGSSSSSSSTNVSTTSTSLATATGGAKIANLVYDGSANSSTSSSADTLAATQSAPPISDNGPKAAPLATAVVNSRPSVKKSGHVNLPLVVSSVVVIIGFGYIFVRRILMT